MADAGSEPAPDVIPDAAQISETAEEAGAPVDVTPTEVDAPAGSGVSEEVTVAVEDEAPEGEGPEGAASEEGNDEGAGVDEEDPEAKADVATDDAPPAVEEAPPPEEEPEDDIDRPMSSMTEQGAIEIEGFDDDFEEDNFLGDEMRDQYEDEEDGFDEVPEADQAPDLEAMINEQADLRQQLMEINQGLQRKLYTLFSNRKTTELRDAQGKLQAEGQETRYQQALVQWAEQQEEQERISTHFETQTFDMKARLEERMTRAEDIRKAFRVFQLEVARSSENSRTGNPIPEKIIQERMHQELRKAAEVERVRLKNITLRNQMKKLESHLKAKEELAEGLHLIDFEQLKIENQSLNEKIEERNEELLKLRKKTTTTVQVLTHLKEKLQFVQKENEVLQAELEDLDGDLAGKRDQLNKEKLDRDMFRIENARIKAQSGIVTNPNLLDDMEIQKERRDVLQERVDGLKTRHTQIMVQIDRMHGELEFQQSQEMGISGSMPSLTPM
mmetsp:Transcript_7815/g.14795  ORF Transcript_7815/g.14795 Transcript_7815/m.14795 type:complete len:500 (+) Transcript_7815:235-1734(+)|eukprot:CAMPEP_0114250106 /NCGR_PEP_ID=MMETSP0058-20121206/14519_1 /TAXON_ID=36894 /ORGANISM="Pyramimonas parkeae, CCMP726" /LENGTH=499 /DNA_ID=CAMNT_0001363737 /DNA_START=229 /DNA_END=1728 /DNA_ORIENTATION=+